MSVKCIEIQKKFKFLSRDHNILRKEAIILNEEIKTSMKDQKEIIQEILNQNKEKEKQIYDLQTIVDHSDKIIKKQEKDLGQYAN